MRPPHRPHTARPWSRAGPSRGGLYSRSVPYASALFWRRRTFSSCLCAHARLTRVPCSSCGVQWASAGCPLTVRARAIGRLHRLPTSRRPHRRCRGHRAARRRRILSLTYLSSPRIRSRSAGTRPLTLSGNSTPTTFWDLLSFVGSPQWPVELAGRQFEASPIEAFGIAVFHSPREHQVPVAQDLGLYLSRFPQIRHRRCSW